MHREARHDESVVFVLGAGASSGESLKALEEGTGAISSGGMTPPLTTGFFKRELYAAIGYESEKAESDFPPSLSLHP